MGTSYRMEKPQVSVQDIIAIKSNPNMRLTSSPFGLTAEEAAKTVYVGRAAPWKGLTGNAFWAEASKHGNLTQGLRSAIAISKSKAGIKGTVWVGGKLYPKKAIAQMKGTPA